MGTITVVTSGKGGAGKSTVSAGLGCALADMGHKVLLLDGDAGLRSLDLMLLLEKINELGTTVLVVTHEKELVNRFAKRVIAIDNGRIISDGMDGYYSYDK